MALDFNKASKHIQNEQSIDKVYEITMTIDQKKKKKKEKEHWPIYAEVQKGFCPATRYLMTPFYTFLFHYVEHNLRQIF